jgi:uncharacterized membrane protein
VRDRDAWPARKQRADRGASAGDHFRRSANVTTFGVSSRIGCSNAIVFSTGITAIAHLSIPGSEILGRSQPNLLDLGVALAAGAIAGFARVNTKIASSIGGAAIAVALMPPLCVVGIGLALHAFELSYGALLLFITNLLGITLACSVVFVLFRLSEKGARRGLITTAILVVAVAVPLVFATLRLIEQQRLESVLRESLVHDIQTFKHVELVSTDIDWVTDLIRVQLLVRMQGTLTPTQVGFLQSFASKRIHSMTCAGKSIPRKSANS